MAEFNSHYKELGFYVKGEYRQFNDGRYVTEDQDTIEVLGKLSDVTRLDEPKPEAKPAKAPARKSSTK